MKSRTKTEGLVKIAMGYNEGRSVVAPLYLTGLLACLLTGCVNKAQQNFDRPLRESVPQDAGISL